MIQPIIILLGIVYFIDAIFNKYHVWKLIEKKGSKQSKFVYKLTSCRFCMNFHLNWIVILMLGFFSELLGFFSESQNALGFFSELSIEIVILPFVVSGLINFIKSK